MGAGRSVHGLGWFVTEHPAAPATEAGRRLFTDNEPMDMWESDGVTWEDITAVEAEARAAARKEVLDEAKELLDSVDDGPNPRSRFRRILEVLSTDTREEPSDAR